MRIGDLAESAQEGPLAADLCIVGSGAAGLTIAAELAGSGIDILVLESGARSGEEAFSTALGEIESVGAPRVLDQTLLRNRVFGGSTLTWSGRCVPMEPLDFEMRPWLGGAAWPVTAAEMQPYFERAAPHLGVATTPYDERLLERLGLRPRFREGDGTGLRSLFWQFSRGPGGSLDYVRFAPRFERLAPANVRVLTRATVVEIVTDPGGSRVEEIVVKTPDGTARPVRAGMFVLAGGGIENARLLLASRRHDPAGVGNRHDLVGRFLMDHPRTVAGAFDPADLAALDPEFGLKPFHGRARMLRGLSLALSVQREERHLNAAAWLTQYFAQDDAWRSLRAILRREGQYAAHLRNVAGNAAQVAGGLRQWLLAGHLPRRIERLELDIMVEQVPDRDSRILLSDRTDALGMPLSRIDWRIGEAERRTVMRLARAIRDGFAAVGLPAPRLAGWIEDDRPGDAAFHDPAHPIGSTRMADSPLEGVVDREGRVHGVNNLYVCGSSTFATAGHANPTHTIVAFAIRQADALRRRLRDPVPAPAVRASRPRVLVTGAAGFVGGHLLPRLVAAGYRVRALTSREPPLSTPDVEWRRMDWHADLDFAPQVEGCAAIVHLGAELRDTARMPRANVEATAALAAAGAAAGVSFFLYVSTVSVYGSPARRDVDEDSPLVPVQGDIAGRYRTDAFIRDYAQTKLRGEEAVRAAGLARSAVVRPSVIVDFPDMTESAGWGRRRKQLNASRHPQHVYVGDVAAALVWLTDRGLAGGPGVAAHETYNLTDEGPQAHSFAALWQRARDETGDPAFACGTAVPAPLDILKDMVKFRGVRPRYPLGRIRFSGERLRAAGFRFPTGIHVAHGEAIRRHARSTVAPAAERDQPAGTGQETAVDAL